MMMAMEKLDNEIRKCRKCRLWKGACNAVPGEGPADAKIMLVGQNPGRQEDLTGRPFTGLSGKFLDNILKKNGLSRKRLFITSVVKHRTPGNRQPRSDEIAACLPYLEEQVGAIKPKLIVIMGKIAQKSPRHKGITYIETCHPAAAARFPKMRKRFEEDFRKLNELVKN
jgi:DNA polymerase